MNRKSGRKQLKARSPQIGNWLKYYNRKELTDEEVLIAAEKSGTFNFLNDTGEDTYTKSDGVLYHTETGGKP